MSISLINPKNTTEHHCKGILGYANSAINIALTVDGRVFNLDRREFVKPTSLVNLKFTETGKAYATTFSALFCALHGLKKDKSSRTLLIIPELGWRPQNVAHINTYVARQINNKAFINLAIKINNPKEQANTLRILKAIGYYYGCGISEYNQIGYIYTNINGAIMSKPSLNDSKKIELTSDELRAVFNCYNEVHGVQQNVKVYDSEDEYKSDALYKDKLLTLQDIEIIACSLTDLYITTDNLRFKNVDAANRHQNYINTGVKVAQDIIAASSNFELAEQVFNVIVKYDDTSINRRPLADILADNPVNTTFVRAEPTYTFSDMSYLRDLRPILIGKSFSKSDALAISRDIININNSYYNINKILNK